VRTVIGYHACSRVYAEEIGSGKVKIDEWRFSTNKYDWLGDGIYFWEDGLRRAREWARDFVEGRPGIVRAEIDLGRCLDLAETENLDLIREMHARIVARYRAKGWRVPTNRELTIGKGYRRTLLRWLDNANEVLYGRLVCVSNASRKSS
jgi:hypothetical protein